MLASKQKKFSSKFNSIVDVLKKKKSLLFLLSFILVVVFVITLANSFAVETEVTSITIDSNDLVYSTDAGSWEINIGASMDAKVKGQVNLYYDFYSEAVTNDEAVDLVLMIDDSSDIIWGSAIESFAEIFLSNNDNNTLAIIRFNSVGELVSDFGTSTEELAVSNYGNVDGSDGLSYYAALETLDEFLSAMTYSTDHSLEVMLITDGDPAKDLGKEKELYTQIRENHPHLSKFYAIQYNEKGQMNETLKKISDIQYLATTSNECESLYWFAFYCDTYDSFRLTTQINDDIFDVVSVEKDVPWGEYSIENGLLDFSEPFPTGTIFTVDVTLKFKDEYKDVPGLYHILKDTSVIYKLGNVRDDVYSDDTPIISNYRSITYNGNAPSGCTVSNLPSTTNGVIGDVIKISDKIPVCNGYKFNGWDVSVSTTGDSFVMPSKNVTLTAKWSKATLNKSMNGTVYGGSTLYDFIASDAKIDTGIDMSSFTGKGVYTYESTKTDKYPVHYYHGTVDNNNLIFAGFCWKIVRTTSTGGVKIIYNGYPDNNNQCTNDTDNIGESTFNYSSEYLSSVGYTYGDQVTRESYKVPEWYVGLGLGLKTLDLRSSKTMGSTKYYFGKGTPYFSAADGYYFLHDVTQSAWSVSYIGYFTCLNGNNYCDEPVYIVGGTSTTATYISFYTYNYKESAVSYSGGNYITASGSSNLIFANNYSNLVGTYIFPFNTSSKTSIYYVYSYNSGIIKYVLLTDGKLKSQAKLIFGNGVSWDGSQYTLTNTISVDYAGFSEQLDKLAKYNYTCLSTSTKCSEVKYISSYDSNNVYYFTFNNGYTDLNAFKRAVFFDGVNDSDAKTVVEKWYEGAMTDYTKYLEDAVFCSNREIIYGSLASKDSKVSSDFTEVAFAGLNTFLHGENSLTCDNEFDSLTTQSVLRYPVGLLTYDEILLAGMLSNYSYLGSETFWSMTPLSFNNSTAVMGVYNVSGNNIGVLGDTSNSMAIRPVVSLIPGIKIESGDGTSTSPYVLKES